MTRVRFGFYQKMNYEYIIDYLCNTAGASIQNVGERDERVNKRVEAEICSVFERYIVGEEGDEGNDFFKMAEGDVPFAYNGRSYEKIDDVKLRFTVKKVMEKMGVGIVYQKNSADKIAKECLEGLMAQDRCAFEPDRRYVVFPNCVLDTKTGELAEHDIRFKTDVVLEFDYKKGHRSALWDRIIAETIPDVGMRRAFQMFCGAFLINRNLFKIEYICLMVGTGRNGKSVVCKAIADLFGDTLVSSYSPEQLFRSAQSMYNLADINGKICNYADDVSNKDFSGGDFKQFTSGAKFQARHIYGRPFTVTKVPLMLCCVNDVPPTTDDTNGYYRRLLPIICPNQIADKDVDIELPNKLATDDSKSAIFNWIYEGYQMLVANNGKIAISDSIRMAKEEIKDDSNSARRWVKEMGFIAVQPYNSNDARWKPLKEWMAMYLNYCRDFSESPKTVKSVSKIFKEMGFLSEKRLDTTWFCIGVREQGDKPLAGSPAAEEEVQDDGDLPF